MYLDRYPASKKTLVNLYKKTFKEVLASNVIISAPERVNISKIAWVDLDSIASVVLTNSITRSFIVQVSDQVICPFAEIIRLNKNQAENIINRNDALILAIENVSKGIPSSQDLALIELNKDLKFNEISSGILHNMLYFFIFRLFYIEGYI